MINAKVLIASCNKILVSLADAGAASVAPSLHPLLRWLVIKKTSHLMKKTLFLESCFTFNNASPATNRPSAFIEQSKQDFFWGGREEAQCADVTDLQRDSNTFVFSSWEVLAGVTAKENNLGWTFPGGL